jgi:hypothetical protein
MNGACNIHGREDSTSLLSEGCRLRIFGEKQKRSDFRTYLHLLFAVGMRGVLPPLLCTSIA